jgi:hypothetical protein
LDPLAVDSTLGPKQTESVHSVLTNGKRVVVLTAVTGHDREDREGQLASYCVNYFPAGQTRPRWTQAFPSTGDIAHPGVILLWAARAPDKVEPSVQPLTWLGEDVLVCAGPVQDLVCLAADDGKQRWRLERLWEYERGFIGPSIWRHSIGRLGSEDADKEKPGKEDSAKKRLASRHHSIVGGPLVVTAPGKGGAGRGPSIFVAVARGPSHFAEYLSDCVIYELDAKGEPLAMVTLPRMVRGEWYQVEKDGVVWACQGGAFVKLGVSSHRAGWTGMGPGGPDMLCRVAWYRHPSPARPEAWLTSDPAGDPIAFGKGLAFRVCRGGYVTDPAKPVYDFPITVIDLQTGAEDELRLSVPYTGEMLEPGANYTRSEGPDGKPRWRTRGPYVLAITWLQTDERRLRVTLGMASWSRTLEFALTDLPGRKQE